MRVWNTQTGLNEKTFVGHSDRIRSVSFSPDGLKIVSASDDMTLLIYDSGLGLDKKILKGHVSVINKLAFSPDGKYVVSGLRDKTIKIWNFQSG